MTLGLNHSHENAPWEWEPPHQNEGSWGLAYMTVSPLPCLSRCLLVTGVGKFKLQGQRAGIFSSDISS